MKSSSVLGLNYLEMMQEILFLDQEFYIDTIYNLQDIGTKNCKSVTMNIEKREILMLTWEIYLIKDL